MTVGPMQRLRVHGTWCCVLSWDWTQALACSIPTGTATEVQQTPSSWLGLNMSGQAVTSAHSARQLQAFTYMAFIFRMWSEVVVVAPRVMSSNMPVAPKGPALCPFQQ